jgi:HD superfamily phosphohydrolase
MYWQVYLHKTVLSAEFMLVNALRRAQVLARSGASLHCSPALHYFLYNQVKQEELISKPEALQHYASLDDFDIAAALKVWQHHEDRVLAMIATQMVNRSLFKIEIQRTPFDSSRVTQEVERISAKYGFTKDEAEYFVIQSSVDNRAYNSQHDVIRILMKDGSVRDAAEVSDHLNIAALSSVVEKHFVAYLR